jgi:hypothetical protein
MYQIILPAVDLKQENRYEEIAELSKKVTPLPSSAKFRASYTM